ncbi:PVC-type heme-binding CxxCH protein [Larkinella bovis]|uniref:PVC-type heme-binding CxxCH protein n=1 Tax=Larkinella bovis TaxID=683041 RepID=A0ABW0IEF8_9BACT
MTQLIPNRWVIIVFLSALCCFSCTKKRYADALSPDEALQHFQLRDGFGIETFAAEPLIADPVDLVFDEQGTAYVIEMGDYPGKPEAGNGKGKIRMLADTNQDGRIDRSVVFADSIPDATSLLPWEGGLIVAAAPDILFLKDTTGDFRADMREVLFTGFFANNSEAQITCLRYGIDNWIYANNNGQEGQIRFLRKPDAPALTVNGGDFRFRLDRGLFEVESGTGQFGLALDDWGHRFFTQNTIHIQQAPIAGRYLRRNPDLIAPKASVNISDHDLEMFQQTPPPYWRRERTDRRQKQYDEAGLGRKEYAEDHFTGASGGTYYDGDAFPPGFYGSIFTGDVAGNLVHRDVLTPANDSPVWVAKRAEGETDREFLASTDPWFRPANLVTGPDGFLYVVDMYRQHIETPVSIPDDLKADMDFLNGNDKGRIYRIFPKNAPKRPATMPNLRQQSPAEWVKLLAHPNRWFRLHAQRLLLERNDRSVVPVLKTMVAQHTDPRARLHALYTLEGLVALDKQLVQKALQDPQPGVRDHGLLLAERYPELFPQILNLTGDASLPVALQACLSAGQVNSPAVVSALAKALARHPEDAWFRTAVLSSLAGSSPALLTTLANQKTFFSDTTAGKQAFLTGFSRVIGHRKNPNELSWLVDFLNQPNPRKESWQLAGLTGLAEGLQKSDEKTDPGTHFPQALQQLEASTSSAEVRKAIAALREALAKPVSI